MIAKDYTPTLTIIPRIHTRMKARWPKGYPHKKPKMEAQYKLPDIILDEINENKHQPRNS